MEQKYITIGDKEYTVKVAITPEEKRKGLQNVRSLPKDEGMLFVFDEPEDVSFWMKDTYIPLDIVFIDEDSEVISVEKGEPQSTEYIEEDDVMWVLEVNAKSGIKEGDELHIYDKKSSLEDTMQVLAPDGSVQMNLVGGERIFSRRSTKVLIKKAKKADKYKDDPEQYKKYCKALGKYIFKELDAQEKRDPEYVTLK